MQGVLANEFLKTWGKWRSAIPFITIGVIVPLILVGVKFEAEGLLGKALHNLPVDPGPAANLLNGYFTTILIMNGLWIHIPFLLTLVAGDQLAGEGGAGTFRILLTRPASRSRIWNTKYTATLAYTAAVVAFLVGVSLLLGILLFGSGACIVPWRGTLIPEGGVPPRLLLSFLLAVWGMWSVASLAFLFSVLVDNPIGPILATMGVIIALYAIATIPTDFFQALRPFLFTTHLSLWQKALEPEIPWREIVTSSLALGGFNVGFYSVGWYIFQRKDILS